MTQAVLASIIAVTTIFVLFTMSRKANSRFQHLARLPMQWWFDGSVNWTAPRKVALALLPTFAAGILAFLAVGPLFLPVRSGQENEVAGVTLILALAFVGMHALYLWVVARTSKPNDR